MHENDHNHSRWCINMRVNSFENIALGSCCLIRNKLTLIECALKKNGQVVPESAKPYIITASCTVDAAFVRLQFMYVNNCLLH